jgi:type IV pilus assembly protein PilC
MAEVISSKQFPFTWEGMDKRGKRIKGRMLAVSEAAVRTDLRKQGVVPRRSARNRSS